MKDKAEYANYLNDPDYASNLHESPARSPSALHSIELWLADNLIEHLSFGITLVFAFACWFFTDDAIRFLPINDNIKKNLQSYGLLIITILFILIIIIYSLQNRQKQRNSKLRDNFHNLDKVYKNLKSENYQLNEELSQTRETIRSLCEGYLYSLANGPLKFASVPYCYERITLYAHDYDHFIPIGRVSFAPEYAKKGRPSYPEGEGCIAQAWKNIWHFANDYPDPEVCPKEYTQRCKIDSISEEYLDEIGMKSRLYCGFRISDTSGKKPMAVLIIEATSPDRYTEVSLRKILNEEGKRRYLSDLTEKISPIMPSCKEARDEGY
jgi:FtsZ-binding cell division protein ZapB